MRTLRRFVGCGLTTIAVATLFVSIAIAEWHVAFESKTVYAGRTGVEVSLILTTDGPMCGMTIPVIVREITPGAFWTGELPWDTGRGGGFVT